MIKGMVMLASFVALVSCGGGSGSSGSAPFGDGDSGVAGGTPATADLILELSKPNVSNTGSDSVGITVTAVDSSRTTLAGAVVQVTADNDGVITTSSSTTGADGKLLATLTIGGNRSNRVISVSARSGSAVKATTVQVSGAALTATLVPAVIAPSTAGKVQYRLLDSAGNPMVGLDFQIVAANLVPSSASGKTGQNGDFEFLYTSPAAVGTYDVSVSVGGVADSQPIQVQTANTIPPATQTITSASISANPSVIGINATGSSASRSDIRALFQSANNQPVKNVRVKFDLAGDSNSIGGSFTTGKETLLSDVNGVAVTAYTPASRSSPTNGVTVRACYYKTDAEAAADPYDAAGKVTTCTNSSAVTLTVTSEPLGVSIGTNELIIVNELTYVKKYVVSVVDSAGVAKPDVNLVVSLDLPQYRKGQYVLGTESWIKQEAMVCANEDTNRNGLLEAGENVNGAIPYTGTTELNNRLEPGKSDVSVTLLHSKTRADGTAELQIQYAKSFGSWVDARITVAASGVLGTEGRAFALVPPVPVDAASIKAKDVTPAYAVSPYGRTASCLDPN
jgi:hypothetical protein